MQEKPQVKGILTPLPWSENASRCSICASNFGVLSRKNHCRGCGEGICTNCSVTQPLKQYGFVSPTTSCLNCALYATLLTADIPTTGGEVKLQVYNIDSISDLKAEFNDEKLEILHVKSPKDDVVSITISAILPPGAGLKQVIKLTKVSQSLSTKLAIKFTGPTILRTSSPSTRGGEVVIFGDNFGENASKIRVLVDNVPATDISIRQPHKKVSVKIPGGTGLRVLRVEVDGQSCESEILHAPPEIAQISPSIVSVAGGDVTIEGSNFGEVSSRIQVLFPEFEQFVDSVSILDTHSKISVTLPPIRSLKNAKLEKSISVSVIVDGLHSVSKAQIVYSSNAKPQSVSSKKLDISVPGSPSRRAVENAPTSPYAAIFSPSFVSADTPNSDISTQGALKETEDFIPSSEASVQVAGMLTGDGPMIKITPQKEWDNDADICSIIGCGVKFTLLNRRHHCRCCGKVCCSSCSPKDQWLQFAPGKPSVRTCTPCHLKLGLLNQMASAVEAIHMVKRVLTPQMYQKFKAEILKAVDEEM
jgi:FYVE zinc finger/IPT/TIG domain